MAVELHNLLADVAVVSSVGGKHNEKQGAFGSITSGDDRKPGQVVPEFWALAYFVCNYLQIDKAAATEHNSLHVMGNSRFPLFPENQNKGRSSGQRQRCGCR